MSARDPGRRRTLSVVAGCLLGGALGEAVGRWSTPLAPGAADLLPGARGGAADLAADQPLTIGWHTQLAMVTAEGLLRADNRLRARGFADLATVVYLAYRRWLVVQGQPISPPMSDLERPESWLLRLPALADRRGLSAAMVATIGAGVLGRPTQPINDHLSSDVITRVAPVGLLPPEVDVALVGMEVAALTHGHPIAQFAAGFVAVLIHRLLAGRTLDEALTEALTWLGWARRERRDGETLAPLVETLRRIRQSEVGALASAAAAGVVGAGHTADEALAIALARARGARDVEHGLRLAAGHGGAHDATGALTGQILGAAHGVAGLPEGWLAALDVGDALRELSHDWDRHFFSGGARDQDKYPGF